MVWFLQIPPSISAHLSSSELGCAVKLFAQYVNFIGRMLKIENVKTVMLNIIVL